MENAFLQAYRDTTGMVAIVYIFVYIIQGCIFGAIARYISSNKGYDGGFAWGFFLGIIGLLVVGLRPDNVSRTGISTREMYPETNNTGIPANSTWTCYCGQENSYKLDYCLRCHRTKDEALAYTSANKIACPHCGAMNAKGNLRCFACNANLTDDIPFADAPKSNTDIDMIQKLAELHAAGILTDEEFADKKKEILSRV